ncbi:hypothetical protein [Actinoplanes sp. GCM10030250]|uniref:hypothetical protein n=1 Tax=Actinoplanes sp. GCM10030250 TaxID=3273376 RepID=UPI003605C76E
METRAGEPGPYSRTKMRVLAVVGVVSGLLVLGMALLERAGGNPNAGKLIWLACAPLAVLAITVPLAKHRGRM